MHILLYRANSSPAYSQRPVFARYQLSQAPTTHNTKAAKQSQTAVTAHLKSSQLLLFVFVRRNDAEHFVRSKINHSRTRHWPVRTGLNWNPISGLVCELCDRWQYQDLLDIQQGVLAPLCPSVGPASAKLTQHCDRVGLHPVLAHRVCEYCRKEFIVVIYDRKNRPTYQQTWDVGPTLIYCWANSKSTLGQRLIFARMQSMHVHYHGNGSLLFN